MAQRLPRGSAINTRHDGPCALCGEHVPLFGGYVVPGIKAASLYCVPCSVSDARMDPACKPALPRAAE